MTRMKVFVLAILVIVLIGVGAGAGFFLNGMIKINHLRTTQYPVQGVDVSSYQGDIQWQELANQGIQFAIIKATEGSKSVDPNFYTNYEQALKTNIHVGAYHFFSYDSSGLKQARHFIDTVPKNDQLLPPVVDVEFYGDKKSYPPKKAIVRKNLTELLNQLEAYYGKKPIIYATEKSYNLYISGGFSEYGIWISNVRFPPSFSDDRKCTFWQYSHRGKLEGYNGKYIDKNVFCGSQADFDTFIKK